MALLSGALSAPLQEPSLQEVLAYLNSLHIPQSQEVGGANKARELYEAILRRGGGDDIEDEAIQAKIMEILQAHQSDKRANYMSLCHFKICNMGRKRTLWPRN